MIKLSAAFLAGLLLAAPVGAQRPDAATAAPSPTSAQADEPPETPPTRMSTLVVYGDDPCPRSRADEIVVCAREPESERYRMPKRFRESAPGPAAEAWSNRVQTLETVSRIGTPNSCSPVGSGGATGCMQQFLQQARDEQRQNASDSSGVP